jgi:hypothetical protein
LAAGVTYLQRQLNSPRPMSKIQRALALIGAFVAWTVVALAVDRYVLRDLLPWLSRLLYFKNAEILVRPFNRTFGWLGLTLVLVLPSFFIGLSAALYLKLKKKETWSTALAGFGILSFWFFLIPFLIWTGDVIYRFTRTGLNDWAWARSIADFCDGFIFKGDLYTYGFKIVHVESGLGAIAGLVLGVILYYRFGLWEIIKKRLRS